MIHGDLDAPHAQEIVRLCTVAFDNADRSLTAPTQTERGERVRIALNAILRAREIAERFVPTDKEGMHGGS